MIRRVFERFVIPALLLPPIVAMLLPGCAPTPVIPTVSVDTKVEVITVIDPRESSWDVNGVLYDWDAKTRTVNRAYIALVLSNRPRKGEQQIAGMMVIDNTHPQFRSFERLQLKQVVHFVDPPDKNYTKYKVRAGDEFDGLVLTPGPLPQSK